MMCTSSATDSAASGWPLYSLPVTISCTLLLYRHLMYESSLGASSGKRSRAQALMMPWISGSLREGCLAVSSCP
eukprot:COSAG01_NODE_35155_length_536_cov_0.871854_1_plen_74_part_00